MTAGVIVGFATGVVLAVVVWATAEARNVEHWNK